MKVKTDFVTNSSSTSFFSEHIYPAKVALMMLHHLAQQRNLNINSPLMPGADEDQHMYELRRAIAFLEQNITLQRSFSFPWSCNYETFIHYNEDDGNIYVETCNNDYYERIDDIQITESSNPDEMLMEFKDTTPFVELETLAEIPKWLVDDYYSAGYDCRLPQACREGYEKKLKSEFRKIGSTIWPKFQF